MFPAMGMVTSPSALVWTCAGTGEPPTSTKVTVIGDEGLVPRSKARRRTTALSPSSR